MTPEPDLFDDLPPPSGPKIPEPTEAEVTAAIEQIIDDDGLCLSRAYVRDMLAGRDPTDPAQATAERFCGNCGNHGDSHVEPGEIFCDCSLQTVKRNKPACDFWGPES
jgi:hypothetical protein